ncbi:glycosyl transferase family 1 [Frondihabitans australicus]|uniref:D-inositol 3-phosphate glycosyltransferase n=1 Tax=Frondihabitans australicus TaxID=386892 RepID=A0A495IAA1_9MICO|nr:glycosyl transferase family 1 [Frondihabitans australicus]
MLEVLFPEGRDVAGWAERHGRGETPGLWPYGLDGLRALDPDARIAELAKPTRFEAARARLLPGRRPKLGSAATAEVGITWDENTGRLMALTRPHERMYTGVIWVTDLVARGRDTGRMREILREMDGLWVISRGQLEPLRDFVGDDGPPIAYFRFGVDADFFPYRPYPTQPLVVSVGGDRDRDAATLFAALEQVHESVPEARIVVQTTSTLTAPRGVETVAHLSHRELADLYAEASVVAIATGQNLHASGMTVSLEAMATGRPVVMTRTPGIEDYVDHGSTGLLVPVGDAEALSEGVVRLLGDPRLAEAYGRAGRAEVEEWGTTRAMVERMGAFLGLTEDAR